MSFEVEHLEQVAIADPAMGIDSAAAWYCARTKPKHEHIAAANLRTQEGLQVFHPRLRSTQTTFRGVVKQITEPVFPGYIFVRCNLEESLDVVRHTSGVSSLVSFGLRIPEVPHQVIGDLMECFGEDETLPMERQPSPGDIVQVTTGAFFGMEAVVLRSWPAKRRVQILLDILGRPTPMEVASSLVTIEGKSVCDMVPVLAAG
jgi:transcriptional antiterminator RfaH